MVAELFKLSEGDVVCDFGGLGGYQKLADSILYTKKSLSDGQKVKPSVKMLMEEKTMILHTFFILLKFSQCYTVYIRYNKNYSKNQLNP